MKYQRERWLLIMTPEEALTLLDTLLQGQKLRDIQELVFSYSWQGWTYPQIAQHLSYDLSYIRDVGSELWRQLTQEFGERVTKKNVQTVLRRQISLRQNLAAPIASSDNTSVATDVTQTLKETAPSNFTANNRIVSASIDSTNTSNTQYGGGIIDVSSFHGRSTELVQLQQWIVEDRCRLVAVVGMGGIGKTTLIAKLTEQLQDEFDFLIWHSLRNVPTIAEVLVNSIHCLSKQQEIALTLSIEALISQLIEYLRSYRCLLILDNFDAVLGGTDESNPMQRSQAYREGYEGYEVLLRRIGSEIHSSCLLLTSREKPKILTPLEGKTLPVRTLVLAGLRTEEIQAIFRADGCFSEADADWTHLLENYAGNPLALKIVSTTVRDVFDGSISEFLAQGSIAFGDINVLLDEQFDRLSDLEKQVMYWLAIDREWVSLAELREDFVPRPPQHILLEALLSLVRRSLIEKNAGSFTLQPVVMEYVTEKLLECICEELKAEEFSLFITHALIQAQKKDYIRESQIRVILAQLAQRLICQFRSKKEVEYQLKSILFKLRSQFPTTVGYAGGNIINLLRQLQIELSDYDFSYLSIRQANLQDLNLHRVNFANSEFVGSTFTQTFGSILSVAFSPDDRLLAAAGANEDIHLWQIADGQQFLTLKGHTNWVLSVVFSPDGQLLASAGEDCRIKLWHVRDGNCLMTLIGHTDYVHSVSFSPDGEILASSSIDQTLKLWSVKTGECLNTLHGHESWIERVVFNSNGQMLASGSNDRTIKLWDTIAGECVRTLYGHSDQVSSVAFSPDDRILASSSGDRTIKLWDVNTGECFNTLQGHSGQIWSLAFIADGSLLASGSHDRTIKLWDVPTGQCLRTLQGHASQVRSIAFDTRGSTIASGSGDQTIGFWDVQTGQRIKTLQGYSSRIWSIAFNADGTQLASGSYDRTIGVWDVSNGTCLRTLRGHSSWVRSVEFSPDGSLLASGSGDQTVKLWDTTTWQCSKTLHGHNSWIRSIAFSPDGKILASASHDRTIRLWNLETYQSDRILSVNTIWTRAIAFSAQSSANMQNVTPLIGCLDETTMGLWDANTCELLRTFEGHTAQIWSAVFSPDGQILASSSRDQTVKLWDTNSGCCLQTLQGHDRDVWSVAFSTDGNSLATGGDDRTVRIWDVNTGRSQEILQGHQGSVQSVVYSPDTQTLASGSEDETIKIWDIKTARCLRTLRATRPYEGMNISGTTGLTEAQKMTLIALGAIEQ
jgi:WD40 repeat protein